MQPIRMLAPLVAMLMGFVCQPVALLAAEGMKQPKPVLTAEPWDAWVKAEDYDENAPLPYDWSTPEARPRDSKKPPIGDPDWGLITGDGRVQGRGCIGDFRYPACIAETMIACGTWSMALFHPICDLLRSEPGSSGYLPHSTIRWFERIHPWSRDVYYMLRVSKRSDLFPEHLFRLDPEESDDLAVVIYQRWCQPDLRYEIRSEYSYITDPAIKEALKYEYPIVFRPMAPKDQCHDEAPVIAQLRPTEVGYKIKRHYKFGFWGMHDAEIREWFVQLSPYPERE